MFITRKSTMQTLGRNNGIVRKSSISPRLSLSASITVLDHLRNEHSGRQYLCIGFLDHLQQYQGALCRHGMCGYILSRTVLLPRMERVRAHFVLSLNPNWNYLFFFSLLAQSLRVTLRLIGYRQWSIYGPLYASSGTLASFSLQSTLPTVAECMQCMQSCMFCSNLTFNAALRLYMVSTDRVSSPPSTSALVSLRLALQTY